jgi:hypothetical protein
MEINRNRNRNKNKNENKNKIIIITINYKIPAVNSLSQYQSWTLSFFPSRLGSVVPVATSMHSNYLRGGRNIFMKTRSQQE